MTQLNLSIRSAINADKAAVLAFCTHTWSGGDYIAEVWDRWITDRASALLVGTVDDQPAALAHIVVRDGEGWFEGLRVAPQCRGRGVARRMIEDSCAEARQRGAHVVRLLTNHTNAAMLHLLPEIGFNYCFTAAWYSATAQAAAPLSISRGDPQPLLAQVQDGPWLAAANGLYAHGWSFVRFSATRLAAHSARHQIVHVPQRGWAIVMPDGESDQPAIALAVGDIPAVLGAVRSHPLAHAHGTIRTLLPVGSVPAQQATAAGYEQRPSQFNVYARQLLP